MASCFRNSAHITRPSRSNLSRNEVTALRGAGKVHYSSTFRSVTRCVYMLQRVTSILLVSQCSCHHCIVRCTLTLHTVIDLLTYLLIYLFIYCFLQAIPVESSSSFSIASPYYYDIYPTTSFAVTCSWKISTANGYILQLTFDKMSISSCSGCSCGYVEVRDGRTSSGPLTGTYCDRNRPSSVSSKGRQMFVKYYGQYSVDRFRATVRSKEGTF